MLSGYHQVPLHANDVPKTAFRTLQGSSQFKVLSRGLTNAPSTFVHVMNKVFQDQLNKHVLVYLDDILVFSKTAKEQIEHVREVLQALRKHKLLAKQSKCHFEQEVHSLGHLVNAQGIKIDPKKVNS